jgi:undecaprenyl-diphosphatase
MPSSHAANAFGQAVLFSVTYRRWAWPLLVFAALVALSRVFVGVHYPFDILVGSIIGAVVGYIGAWLARKFLERRLKGV